MITRPRLAAIAALCALVALIVRGVALAEVADAPYFRWLVLDASTYHRIAVGGDPAEPFYHPPLYPWLLRGVYLLAGPSPTAMRVLQIVAGAGVSAMVVALVARFGGSRRAALAGGLATALYGPLVQLDLDLLPASLGAAVVTGLALLAGEAAIATGLLFGAGILLLPSLGAALVGVAIWLATKDVRRAALVVVTAALVIAPVTIRNWRIERDLVPVSYNGGVNLWLGNSPDYPATLNARPGQRWERVAQLPMCHGDVRTRAQLSAWYTDEVLRESAAHPGAALGRLVRKAAEVLNAREIGRNRDAYEVRGESRVLASLLWPAGFPAGVLIPLATVGAVALARRRALPVGPALLVASVLAVGVLYFPTARYRVPAVPIAIAIAAAGVPRARRGDWLAGAVALAVTALPSQIPTIPASATPYAIGLDRFTDGDLDAAVPWLEDAIARTPDDADALTLLGHIHALRGRRAEARGMFERAVAADPHSDKAWEFLGNLARAGGDPAGAVAAWTRAVAENPCNRDARARLARAAP